MDAGGKLRVFLHPSGYAGARPFAGPEPGSNGRVFFDATSEKAAGGPDGIKVDDKGNLYGAGPGGVWIFSPEGRHLGTLKLPEKVANCAWGGADGKTLYITASTSLYRIRLKIPGVRP